MWVFQLSRVCAFWLLAPFKNPPAMIWAIGGSGLRTTLTLSDHFAHVLNHFLAFEILGVTVPTGLLLFVALVSFFVWLLFQTKTGGRP